uniref:threonine synthase n=1 Tax=Mycena chlorophos TaxID=658473 RepID=A0ABQ0L480_MYCCL|nr:tryptophan synthase beta subunit-like PLP-dependent enzyme [Mycena chlorophos]
MNVRQYRTENIAPERRSTAFCLCACAAETELKKLLATRGRPVPVLDRYPPQVALGFGDRLRALRAACGIQFSRPFGLKGISMRASAFSAMAVPSTIFSTRRCRCKREQLREHRWPLSYLDIARCLFELEGDLKLASQNLALSTVQLVQGFDAIATQLHSVDIQAIMPPLKPQWKRLRSEYLELLSLLRTNVLNISARIKMFCAVILPLSVQQASSRRQQEKAHVLHSYMTISADQAALAFGLVDKAITFNSVFSNFHRELARATSQQTSTSPRELQDLAHKTTLLHKSIKQLYTGSSKLSCPDATYPAYTAFRLIVSAGQQTAKTKLSRYHLTLDSNLAHMSTLFQGLDDARNEIAHAQYAAKMSHRTSEVLSTTRTAVSDLVPRQMLLVETMLSLVMAIWLRLQADCLDIGNWVRSPSMDPPACIAAYSHGSTIYETFGHVIGPISAFRVLESTTMKYFSTRGGGPALSFEETVLTGLAPDGGLYIPESIPSLPPNWQSDWKTYSFVDLSVAVLSLYISRDEISEADLRALVQKSYSTFRHPDITPLAKLDDKRYVLELFHGPTFAFKDVALQLLGNLFEFFLLRRNARKAAGEKPEKLTVVGATSGDTGSAAIYGLRNKANISIFILHPKGRVSPIQEAQMTTVTDANVHNIAVQGTFDDCQDIVKTLFGDVEFNATHRLGAVNSINWARILAQTVYYFLAYFQLQAQLPAGSSPEIQFVVPTGNFGDILAGYYAKRMGLPMGKLVVATNANDILARFWNAGKYEKADSELPVSDGHQSGVKETLSPAMDILVSSNFERLLWYLAYENATGEDEASRKKAGSATLAGWMSAMKSDGRVQIPFSVFELARRDFFAERISDEETLATIRSHFEATPSYIADPHTSVGLAAAAKIAPHNAGNIVQIMLSTAHPAKFSEAVALALRENPSFDFERDVLPPEFVGLLEKERNVVDVPRADVGLVKKVIEDFAAVDKSSSAVTGV